MEQSRSQSATALPWSSASTCTSTWRGRSTSFSRYTPSLPKAAPASVRAALYWRREVGRIVHLAHALAAAAGRGLDEHRVAHLLGEGRSLFHAYPGSRRSRARVGTPHIFMVSRRGRLVAHAIDALRGRADEHEVVVGAGAGELRVLGQKAVAGVNRLGSRCSSPRQ